MKIKMIKFEILTKVFTFRWLIVFTILCQLPLWSIYQLSKISQTNQIDTTVFDILFYQFGLYVEVLLIIVPLYIVLISDIGKDNGIENFLFIRLGDKYAWFKYKIISLFFLTFIYLSLAFASCFIISSFSFPISIHNVWNRDIGNLILNGNVSYFNKDFIDVQPYIVIIYIFILLLLSMFTLGLFILLLNFYFKRSAIPLAFGVTVNVINLVLLKCDSLLSKVFIVPHKRMFLQLQTNSLNLFDPNSIAFSILYWLILILILLISTWKSLKYKNFIFEVNEYE